MKNLNKVAFILSGVLLFSVATSYGYMNQDETNSIPELRKQGYSEATLHLVDDENVRNTDANTTYVRYFKEKKSRNIFGRAYNRIKEYTDPIQEDNMFGKHQINYTNNWMGNKQDYHLRKHDLEEVEAL